MEIDRTVLFGAGGLVLGVVLGYAVGTSGRADLEARLARTGDVQASVAALNEAVAGLDARVGAMDARLGVVSGWLEQAADGGADDGAALAARIEALREHLAGEVGGRIEGLEARVAEALSGDMQHLRAGLTEVSERVQTALAGDLDGLRTQLAALAQRPAGGGAAALPAAGGEWRELGIGQTAVFGDGAARVFLSSVDPGRSTARVAAGGFSPQEITAEAPLEVGDCSIALISVAERTATISGSCGAAAPAEETAEAAAAAKGPPQGSGTGEQVRVGATTSLAEGGLRVFLSAFDPAAGSARVAVNGTALVTLAMGEAVTVGDCEVELTGSDGRAAIIDGRC